MMNHHKMRDVMITTIQERIHLTIARKKKYPAIESILMHLMHMQGINS